MCFCTSAQYREKHPPAPPYTKKVHPSECKPRLRSKLRFADWGRDLGWGSATREKDKSWSHIHKKVLPSESKSKICRVGEGFRMGGQYFLTTQRPHSNGRKAPIPARKPPIPRPLAPSRDRKASSGQSVLGHSEGRGEKQVTEDVKSFPRSGAQRNEWGKDLGWGVFSAFLATNRRPFS